MFTKRMAVSLIAGAILGVVCIIGATVRAGAGLGAVYLFAFWYNRLLLGFVIGMVDGQKALPYLLARGAVIGLIVSFAFYSSIGFGDPVGFIAGIIYGVLIEGAAFFFAKRK